MRDCCPHLATQAVQEDLTSVKLSHQEKGVVRVVVHQGASLAAQALFRAGRQEDSRVQGLPKQRGGGHRVPHAFLENGRALADLQTPTLAAFLLDD